MKHIDLTPSNDIDMMQDKPARLKIAVAIATAGRRDILADMIVFLARQTRKADTLMICPARSGDVDETRLKEYGDPVTVLSGPVGLPAQRNVLVENSDADIMVFFDDDFLPAEDFLERMEALFLANPDIVILTGDVIADGAKGPGYSFANGMDILSSAVPAPIPPRLKPTFGGYGCNMAVRLQIVRAHNVRFDEALPLYGWWEDIDFSRRMAPYGTIIRSEALRGVHLGSKSGRTSGVRLGYSQVANMIYLNRKGSIPLWLALKQMGSNVLANHVKAWRPEPWVDRAGRVKGNWTAFGDLLRGRLDPRRILTL